MVLALSLLAEYNHGQFEMHLKQNKYTDTQLSISEQKKIEKLPEKDIFKVVIPKKISSNI